MEGLRLLDESQRESGAEPAMEAGSNESVTSTAAVSDTSSSASRPAAKTEEEDDVLLDN